MSAGLGAGAWLAAPWLPMGSPPSFGSIEHVFVFLPLVAVPLALVLMSTLLEHQQSWALGVQPVAAAMVLASFFVPKGALAGGLAAGWLVMAITGAIGGVRRAARVSMSLLAAQVFLVVGAVWLLLSRLGVGPRSFAPLTVLLAAVHFHFSGFTLQILIAATGRRLQGSAARLGALHRLVAIGAIAGIPLIAAGNALPSGALKLAGVTAMVLSTIALAALSTVIAFESRSPMAGGLLLVSAGSIAVAMLVAGVYGVGELLGTGWIGIARMVKVHGLLNALGFTLCGLSGHLRILSGTKELCPARRVEALQP